MQKTCESSSHFLLKESVLWLRGTSQDVPTFVCIQRFNPYIYPILSSEELQEAEKYFGPFSDLDLENFKKIRKELQVKYHPDQFEKFEDETVKELATERFH